jgi:hypothetical protein
MDSLPKNQRTIVDYIGQRTILDYVDRWWGSFCACGREIDVCWWPDDVDHDGQWTDDVWLSAHCPECVCDAAPAALRSSVRERYRRLRQDRLSVGLGSAVPDSPLGSIEPAESVRRSLNWDTAPICLLMSPWRRPGTRNPHDPFMEQLVITGTITESRRDDLNLNALAPLPWFDLNVLELPDRPGEPVEVARVLLGAIVRDPKQPGLEWRYGWNPAVPASHGFFSLPPYWQEENYSPHQIGRFVGKAMDLFRNHAAGGRRPQHADGEWYIDEAARYLEEHGGNVPTKVQFVRFTGRPEATMRRHLEDAGLWPWATFKAQAFPSRRPAPH